MLAIRSESNEYWMMAVTIETGEEIWENRDFFLEEKPNYFLPIRFDRILNGNQPPVFDTEETMITFMEKKVIRKWEVETGEMIWEVEVDADNPPAILTGYPLIMPNTDRSVLYVPFDKKMLAIDTVDGSIVWKRKKDFRGSIEQMELVDDGLLVRGDEGVFAGGKPFIDLLDPTTGETRWDEEFKKLKKLKTTNYILEDNNIIVYSDKKMYAINIADGDYRIIGEDLEFKKESPVKLAKRDNNYLLVAAQNIMSVGRDGKPVFHTYCKAPGMSTLEIVGLVASSAAITAAGAMAAYSGGPIFSTPLTSYYVYPVVFFDFPQYGGSVSALDHLYILTDVNLTDEVDGPTKAGLVKVCKNTGKKIASIVLNDRTPIYAIEYGHERVVYVHDEDELVCARF
jgi:outer membrane protein assembly factor BamB